MGNVLSIYQQSYSHSGSDYYTDITQEDVLLQGAGGMYNPDGRTVEYKIAGSSGPATVTTAVLSGGGNYQEQLISLSGTTITLNSGSNTYDYSNYAAERTTNEKQFELPNHLGSVVTVTSDRKRAYDDGTPDGTVDRYLAEINSWSDTYAFGSVATGGVLLGSEYRYGFQGIEKGPEVSTGAYEADFRMVDVRIGRWFSPDPIVKPWESVYAGFANNPIWFTDPSGLDATNGQATPTGGGTEKKPVPATQGDPDGPIFNESNRIETKYYDGGTLNEIVISVDGKPSPGSNSASSTSKDNTDWSPVQRKTWEQYIESSGSLKKAEEFVNNSFYGRIAANQFGKSQAVSSYANEFAEEEYSKIMSHCEMCWDPVTGERHMSAVPLEPVYIEGDIVTLGGAAGGKLLAAKVGSLLLRKSAKFGKDEVTGWVRKSIFKKLDPVIQEKVKTAIKKGLVGPVNEQGIIKLTATEAAETGYKYKIKILGKGGDIRIYGNPLENGHIVFDKIMGH